MRRAFLLLALLASSCVQSTNGSVLATFRFDATAFKISRLTVQVLDATNKDLLPPSTRERGDGGLLVPSDSLRLYFDGQPAGEEATLRVIAYSVPQPPYIPDGEPIAVAFKPFRIPAKNNELPLEVALAPIREVACAEGLGGGCCGFDPTTGKDVGGGPDRSVRGSNFDYPACGASGFFCVACNPLSSDNCLEGGCRCGDRPPCEADQLCFQGACICSAINCFGCCNGNRCVAPNARSARACGGGAAQCVSCPPADTCANGATCTAAGCGLCGATECCTGNSCQQAGHPRCRAPDSNACLTCDSFLSNVCKPTGGCGCGLGDACRPDQYCDRALARPQCVPR